VEGEGWEVEGATGNSGGGKRQELKDRLGGPGEGGEGWWYYDNKWHDGRRGVDGWGKYTRRRKWVRRAELVEDDEVANGGPVDGDNARPPPPPLPPRERLEEDARDSGSSGSEDGGIRVNGDEDGAVVTPPLPSR